MEKLQFVWSLVATDYEVIKHCSNCGKKVLFTDTLVRRHNANGKNIYRFAIYKCEKNHTWNKKLSIFKANTQEIEVYEKELIEDMPESLALLPLLTTSLGEIEIVMRKVEGKHRMDKVLSQHIVDVSRKQVVEWIEEGLIYIERGRELPKLLKENQKIKLDINKIREKHRQEKNSKESTVLEVAQ